MLKYLKKIKHEKKFTKYLEYKLANFYFCLVLFIFLYHKFKRFESLISHARLPHGNLRRYYKTGNSVVEHRTREKRNFPEEVEVVVVLYFMLTN